MRIEWDESKARRNRMRKVAISLVATLLIAFSTLAIGILIDQTAPVGNFKILSSTLKP
jgi:uncharacterized DUF497 family protein